ncbi:polyamine-transporting ATPase [Amylibacter marinus]|uniref:Spermidine/putrescine import ATP-binding protein PotA n=1 Tax=Amylibacter marinus TaxID=1475483 RepID=A0ABQ5VVK8_9RHOB|nr:ABC transporter ATP-binding protein [Amylibacter marinus]GLQ35465.1 polyamine-transporting ATPase [Amylibacter marinus]
MNTQEPFAPWENPAEIPLIQFKNVTKKFGDFTAIDGLNLDIYAREFFALLGPSGCGKTTLMRLLAGFETPTSGQITLGGTDLAPIPPNKRAVNMMFQSYALFPHLSVADNIAFGLKRSGVGRDALQARVDEMLKLVQLGKFANRKPHQISGGQRQRVALARSLAKAPKLLLLDEPLGALDKKLRQETQFELMDIQESTGTTFVIVTHDQEEAMTVASRVAIMNHGKLEQIDTPDGIYETPNSAYVADFIGEVNLIQGRATAPHHLDWAEGEIPLNTPEQSPMDQGREYQLAIRPEKINVTAQPPEKADNLVQGQVLDIAYLGNLSTYHVKLKGGQIIKAQSANSRRLSRRRFTWEDQVYLSWAASAGVVLDK